MSKTKVISFANNKGGSGKSTTCSNVGYGLTLLGKRVLLVDGDMQLNLSLSFFPEEEVISASPDTVKTSVPLPPVAGSSTPGA